MKKTLHIETELGLIGPIFYENLRNVKREIEYLITEEFHNKKDALGSSFFRLHYTEHIKDVNIVKFVAYLQKAEAIEHDYIKAIKEIYTKILAISGCKWYSTKCSKIICRV